MAALFIIAKTQKQLKYLLTRAQLNKLWCIPTMALYLAIKAIIITCNNMHKAQKHYTKSTHIHIFHVNLIYSDINQNSVCLAAVGTNCKCHKESLGGDGNILSIDYTGVYICQNFKLCTCAFYFT